MECGDTTMISRPSPAVIAAASDFIGRRLLDAGSYGYGDDREVDGEYGYGGDRGVDGGYGGYEGTSRDVPAPSGSCTECGTSFDQCGGGILEASICCSDGLDCVVKNPFYAQCLTPGARCIWFMSASGS